MKILRKLVLRRLPETLAVCWLEPDSTVPEWCASSSFLSVTRSPEELSVVCEQRLVPAEVHRERGWRALRVEGLLDFDEVGVLVSFIEPLATAGISLFALSTFRTDYVLIRESDLPRALEALRRAGHDVRDA